MDASQFVFTILWVAAGILCLMLAIGAAVVITLRKRRMRRPGRRAVIDRDAMDDIPEEPG